MASPDVRVSVLTISGLSPPGDSASTMSASSRKGSASSHSSKSMYTPDHIIRCSFIMFGGA